jgi:ATPase subunit of ABC transporter with duplicated ATPase domains
VETQTTQAPHNAVKAEALSVFAGSRCLLKNTELSIAEQSRVIDVKSSSGSILSVKSGACYGLVGPNGCGKSTLLRLIADKHLPVPSTWDVFLVGQHLPKAVDHSPVEEVLSADAKRAELLELQIKLEEEVGVLAEGDPDMFTQVNDRLMEVVMELGRWDEASNEVVEILLALGFQTKARVGCHSAEPSIETPMTHMSGGWRMKVELAKALWLKPKLLLLDEPTNHLDFQSLHWLENKLEEYPHTVVVVSHDVSFLHSTCREILWIQEQRVESMPRDLVTEDDLARMQRRKPPAFRFDVPDGENPGDHGLSFHKVTFSHDATSESGGKDLRNWVPPLLKVPGDVRFSGTSRSVILGRNGSGKSTFLDLCTGKLTPSRGTVDCTPGLKVAHYSQQTEDLDRFPDESAAAYLVRECRDALAARSSTRTTHSSRACAAEGRAAKSTSAAAVEKRLLEAARGVLSQFGFEGDLAINVPVHRLSGGQKACLKFAVLSLQPAHLLLLDEPTNHLDAEACESLARALSDFKGGVVVVTHDETLIYRLIQCNWVDGELLICHGGGIRREQSIGAQRLNTLKEQVRKAEGMRAKPQRVQQKQVVRKTLDRISTRQAERRANKDEIPDQCPAPNLAKNIFPRSELLAFRFSLDDAVDIKADVPVAFACEALRSPVISTPSANEEDASGHDLPLVTSKQDDELPPMSALNGCAATKDHTSSHELPLVTPKQDVPDDWEQHASASTPTNVPDDWEEYATSPAQSPKCSCTDAMPVTSHSSSPTPEDSSDFVSTLQMLPDPVPCEPEPLSSVDVCWDAGSKRSDGGRHSRLRKDLVNLNKAVSKWIQKEKTGEMSKIQVLEAIRASRVLRELREVHGTLFREDEFIEKLYLQRHTAALQQAEVPVARALERKSSGPRRSRAHRRG